MEKYRYLCFYGNLSSNTLFICFFGSNTENWEDSIIFIYLYIHLFIYLFIEKEKLFGNKFTF